MLDMAERVGCTVIVDGVEYKDKAVGSFNGAAVMTVHGISYRVEQNGFRFTDEEKSFLQAKSKELIRSSREVQRGG